MVPDRYRGAFDAIVVVFLFFCNINAIFVSDSIIFDFVFEKKK